MAGNLMTTPTGFTSLAVGSGTSAGGSAYSSGQEMLGFYTGTFTTSSMTVNPYASATSTFVIGSGLTVGDFIAVVPNSNITSQFDAAARISAAGTVSLTLTNSLATAGTQVAVVFRYFAVKLVP